MIESTLRFDDVLVVPGPLPLLQAVQRSHMQSRKGAGDGLGTRLSQYIMYSLVCTRVNLRTSKLRN